MGTCWDETYSRLFSKIQQDNFNITHVQYSGTIDSSDLNVIVYADFQTNNINLIFLFLDTNGRISWYVNRIFRRGHVLV